MPKRKNRETYVACDIMAGCFICKPDNTYIWHGRNAQGVAARHHDITGHATWVNIYMDIWYGNKESALEE